MAPGAMDTWDSLAKERELIAVGELIFARLDWALLAANTTALFGPGAPVDGVPEEEEDQLGWDQLEFSWPTQ
jgi:hypothetical protein